MRLEKKIVIERGDFSGLHAEISGVLDMACEGLAPEAARRFLAEEFPELYSLHRLLEGQIIAEPGVRVYECLTKKEMEARRIRRDQLKLVKNDAPKS